MQWMAQYNTSYEDAGEEEKYFKIFSEKLQYIENFNSAGSRNYQLGLNEFSDLSVEFCSRIAGNVI